MRFAYADPPYLGMGKRYSALHKDALEWDEPERHRQLVSDLGKYDAWAMSLHSPSLRIILPMCPEKTRVMAWCKPFAYFKPGVNPGYCWEPLLVYGGRKKGRGAPTSRDYCIANPNMRAGFFGAKPETLCHWIFDVLGAEPGDDFSDLFPGSGAVTAAWESWVQMSLMWGVPPQK